MGLHILPFIGLCSDFGNCLLPPPTKKTPVGQAVIAPNLKDPGFCSIGARSKAAASQGPYGPALGFHGCGGCSATIQARGTNFDVCWMTTHACLPFGVHGFHCEKGKGIHHPAQRAGTLLFRDTGPLPAARKGRPLPPRHLLAGKHSLRTTGWFCSKTVLVLGHGGKAPFHNSAPLGGWGCGPTHPPPLDPPTSPHPLPYKEPFTGGPPCLGSAVASLRMCMRRQRRLCRSASGRPECTLKHCFLPLPHQAVA